MRILSAQPRAVGEIASRLPVSRPAVSRHLRVLEKACLVAHERRGNRNVFTLRVEGLLSARKFLEDFWEGSLARFKMVAENTSSRRKAK